MNPTIFFGVLLIILGITYLVGIVLGVSIPLFRILMAILLLYAGISLISGALGKRTSCWHSEEEHGNCYSTFMGEGKVALDKTRIRPEAPFYEYSTTFGSTKVDLSTVPPSIIKALNSPLNVTINTVFGETVVLIRSDVPTRIESSSIFAKTELPDGSKTSFSTYIYQSHPGEKPLMLIKTSTVFGNIDIRMHTPAN
ncbi:MAG: hypothetical protein JW725_03305 [Candidatus Babeliaceae bacterium]|nr:hypothetical protein [Candidatus Babeliaceae bacterium]